MSNRTVRLPGTLGGDDRLDDDGPAASVPLSDADLAAIKARAAKLDTDEYNQGVPKGSPWRAAPSCSGPDRWIVYQPTGSDQYRIITEGLRQPFADFIAHAREDVPALLAALAAERQRADEAETKLTQLREHALDSNPALRTLHSHAVAYLDAVAALSEVRGGAPLSTSLAWLIRQGYLVPAGDRS